MLSSKNTGVAARRDIARRMRDAFPPMGIYAIRDQLTGRVDVRASRHAPGIVNRILFELRVGSHSDKAWQQAWHEGGPGRVRVEVVELIGQREDPAFDYGQELERRERHHRAALTGSAAEGASAPSQSISATHRCT